MERTITNIILTCLLVAGIVIAVRAPGILWFAGFLLTFFCTLGLFRINNPEDWEQLKNSED